MSTILSGVYAPTMSGLWTTWHYFNAIVQMAPTVSNYLYDNILTNPIFYGLLVVLLILNLIKF